MEKLLQDLKSVFIKNIVGKIGSFPFVQKITRPIKTCPDKINEITGTIFVIFWMNRFLLVFSLKKTDFSSCPLNYLDVIRFKGLFTKTQIVLFAQWIC